MMIKPTLAGLGGRVENTIGIVAAALERVLYYM
jgi:hypothetical protein